MDQVEFNYDGYLVFSPSIASFRGEFEDFGPFNFENKILSELPEYSSGVPENPQDGFQPMEFHQHIGRILERTYELDLELEELATLEYTYEEYEETEAYYQGERQIVHLPSKETVDIFWFYPDLILFRGKKSSVNRVRNKLHRIWKDDLLLDDIHMSAGFLESLFHNGGDALKESRLELKQIRSAKFEGRGEVSEISISTGHYDGDISKEYIRGKKARPKVIEGVFEFKGREINSRISPERVHVRSSRGSLKDTSPIGQMAISVSFAKEIVNLALKTPHTIVGDAEL